MAATQQPVTSVDAVCDDLEIDADDNVFVDGELAEQTEYRQRQAMSVLILAARATRSPSASVCLDVELPEMVVTGTVHLCGAASSTILEPAPTPSESEPDATWAPRYGEPMIDGVAIPERLNDWNSYRLLEIADVLDVPVCLDLSAQDNVIRFTISLAVCVSVETDSDDRMTIVIDEREWHFYPEQVLDADGLLAADNMVEASLKIENYRDDSDAYLAMTVWVSPPCSLTGP